MGDDARRRVEQRADQAPTGTPMEEVREDAGRIGGKGTRSAPTPTRTVTRIVAACVDPCRWLQVGVEVDRAGWADHRIDQWPCSRAGCVFAIGDGALILNVDDLHEFAARGD